MVKLALEVSLTYGDDDSYCEARERAIEESASGLAGYGMVSHVAEGTEERVLVLHNEMCDDVGVKSVSKDMTSYAPLHLGRVKQKAPMSVSSR